jgi:hypothetical protein
MHMPRKKPSRIAACHAKTAEQIIGILKEYEAGMKTGPVGNAA